MKETKQRMNGIGKALQKVLGRYKIPILAGLLGLILLLWPSGGKTEKKAAAEQTGYSLEQTQEQMAALLGQIDGAGRVRVMLTLEDFGEAIYQEEVREDGKERSTVLADKAPILVRQRQPAYQGAVIVCEGADRASVKLAMLEAVKCLTGLPGSKISVIKMKGQ